MIDDKQVTFWFSIGLFLALLGLALSTSGCGASALSTQADVAAVVGTSFAAADRVIVQARDADLERILTDARAECPEAGCDDARAEAIIQSYDARVAVWVPVLECRDPVAQAYQAWIDAIWLASLAATQSLGWEHVLAEAARLGLLWRGFRECVTTAAGHFGVALELPDLPGFVYPYLESAAP